MSDFTNYKVHFQNSLDFQKVPLLLCCSFFKDRFRQPGFPERLDYCTTSKTLCQQLFSSFLKMFFWFIRGALLIYHRPSNYVNRFFHFSLKYITKSHFMHLYIVRYTKGRRISSPSVAYYLLYSFIFLSIFRFASLSAIASLLS